MPARTNGQRDLQRILRVLYALLKLIQRKFRADVKGGPKNCVFLHAGPCCLLAEGCVV